MPTLHTIPVPKGWSVEQAWEAIKRGDKLPKNLRWAVVLTDDNGFFKQVRPR